MAQIHGLSRSFIRFPSLLKDSVTVWIFLLYIRGVKMTNCLLQTGLLYKKSEFFAEMSLVKRPKIGYTKQGLDACRNLAVSANIGKKEDGSFPGLRIGKI